MIDIEGKLVFLSGPVTSLERDDARQSPPHLDVGAGWQVGKYGKLDPRGWRRDLTAGFSECLRVLRPGGVLVFKWCEYRIPLRDVLACCPATPILGNRRPKASKTHWVLFMREGVSRP